MIIFTTNKKVMHNPNKLVLLAPTCFQYNEETARNNYFQKNDLSNEEVSEKAQLEHAKMVEKLENNHLEVLVLKDDDQLKNPDAIFLNNWFSLMPDSTLVIYPMWAENRRREVRPSIIQRLNETFSITNILDFSSFAEKSQFCEGTGSIVFDHSNKKAFACISPRTDVVLFEQICNSLNYQPISFLAEDTLGRAIYHTNVMLSIGAQVIVFCSEAVANPLERKLLMQQLQQTGRLVINISFAQMNQFCGNVLEVVNKFDEHFLLMSKTAYAAFDEAQLLAIQEKVSILFFAIPTIEHHGGGSVRCTIAGGYV